MGKEFVNEKTAYHRNTKITCFNDLYPDESCFGAYFASIGIIKICEILDCNVSDVMTVDKISE